MFPNIYDVIVVGGGHAGAEAAAAAANLGAKTLLITMQLQNIAQMSCNPAVGGIAKGQIVREIDALGGYTGVITDKTTIQFKMLNKSKGPAMWSPRSQNDRMAFALAWREQLERIPNLDFYQDTVTGVVIKNAKAIGVETSIAGQILGREIILTNGTFLNGIIHIGEKQLRGGRAGEKASQGITECLLSYGFTAGRMKTGTPPRVDMRSLNLQQMIPQPGDAQPAKFSFLHSTKAVSHQVDCYMTYTSPEVHALLEEGFSQSPMFTGRIQGVGPRYCPSIEDKINRFADKDRHQIFVEPEGRHTVEAYVNGFSTSLPQEVQFRALKRVVGFENVKFLRPGYAIEYDYFPPTQLKHSLETKNIENLFFAGQINGTTGYEEAAAQGLMAGINAVRKLREQDPFILRRDQAYIGVLIDDLITKGTEEPYRMFTSRAEYRTLLRQDNADERLTPVGYELGLASKERFEAMQRKYEQVKSLTQFLKQASASPQLLNPTLEALQSAPMRQADKVSKVLSRPNVELHHVASLPEVAHFLSTQGITPEEAEIAQIQIKYEGYIAKEKENAQKLTRLEHVRIPEHFDYDRITSISFEAREKLKHIRPRTLAQASRISGVSPADISILLVYMGR